MLTLAHLSDLHLPFEPALTPRQRVSKRQLSAWSWRRRSSVQSARVLDALRRDVQAHAVDHVLVTGDVVNFALPDEFRRAADWLAALAPAGTLSIVPGNHDALVAVPRDEGIAHWDAWTDGGAGWPSLRRLGDVSLIGVDSAPPTAPLLARGRIGDAQLARLATILDDEGARGQRRVVALHHAPADGALGWRKALADRASLAALLRRSGCELVLHGHARDARLDALAGPRGPIPCLSVPSSSALPSRSDEGARWHRLGFDAPGSSVSVEVRRWDVRRDAFVDAGAYRLCLPRS